MGETAGEAERRRQQALATAAVCSVQLAGPRSPPTPCEASLAACGGWWRAWRCDLPLAAARGPLPRCAPWPLPCAGLIPRLQRGIEGVGGRAWERRGRGAQTATATCDKRQTGPALCRPPRNAAARGWEKANSFPAACISRPVSVLSRLELAAPATFPIASFDRRHAACRREREVSRPEVGSDTHPSPNTRPLHFAGLCAARWGTRASIGPPPSSAGAPSASHMPLSPPSLPGPSSTHPQPQPSRRQLLGAAAAAPLLQLLAPGGGAAPAAATTGPGTRFLTPRPLLWTPPLPPRCPRPR
jgi:hypothetical protein